MNLLIINKLLIYPLVIPWIQKLVNCFSRRCPKQTSNIYIVAAFHGPCNSMASAGSLCSFSTTIVFSRSCLLTLLPVPLTRHSLYNRCVYFLPNFAVHWGKSFISFYLEKKIMGHFCRFLVISWNKKIICLLL